MSVNGFEERIKQIIVEQINPKFKLEELKSETPLIGRGVGLDSVSLLELIVAIEAEFGVRFDDSDLTPELFQSVSSIASYVGRNTRASQPA